MFNKISLIVCCLTTPYVYAADAPDAGRMLQDLPAAPKAPMPQHDFQISAPKSEPAAAGGAQIVLQAIQVHGHSIFNTQQLQQVLGEVTGKSYDLAGLQALTQRISAFYQTQGYPFARAYLPAQTPANGVVQVEIVEGKYGQINVQGDERYRASVQAFLAPLQAGQIIQSATLERQTLILADLPGVKIVPALRAGESVGTADLDVEVTPSNRLGGSISMDNYGNRYTGRYRVGANLFAYSTLMLGDSLNLMGLGSDGGMWFGNLAYQFPLGGSGLRGKVDFAHSYYQLGKDFASLNAFGTINSRGFALSYPFMRSQQLNLSAELAYQNRALNDQQQTTGLNNSKTAQIYPVTLKFDARDAIAGGGISYGELCWTHGKLSLSDNIKAMDASSANMQGHYQVLNLDISRIQYINQQTSLFGNFAGQWVNKNVDSSEDFSLGGINGVRAYPSGEGAGDRGLLAQIELRYALNNALTPFIFYDSARSTINHQTWSSAENTRTLAGGGLGTRINQQNLSASASLAWPHQGGQSQSDPANHSPRLWLAANYKW